MTDGPPITDEEIAREIAAMGRRNAEAMRRASRIPHPWDEWDIGDGGAVVAQEAYRAQCVCEPSDEDFEHYDGEWALLCACGAYGRWFDAQFGEPRHE